MFVLVRHPVNAIARKKFAIGTLAMITVPISSFFISYIYLFDGVLLSLPISSRLYWSGVVSVLAVQLVMTGFIISAMMEDRASSSSEQGGTTEPRRSTFSKRERSILRQHLKNQVVEEAHKMPESPSIFSWRKSTSQQQDDDDSETETENGGTNKKNQ